MFCFSPTTCSSWSQVSPISSSAINASRLKHTLLVDSGWMGQLDEREEARGLSEPLTRSQSDFSRWLEQTLVQATQDEEQVSPQAPV